MSSVRFFPLDYRYKSNKGALPLGEGLRFSIEIAKALEPERVSIVVTKDNEGPVEYEASFVKELSDGFFVYEVSLDITSSGLYFYHFIIYTEKDRKRVGAAEDLNAKFGHSNDWQLSVYDDAYKAPQWLKGGVFYQIMPDRFFIGGDRKKSKSTAVYRNDWGGLPVYKPTEDGKILNNDFFGGNLAGITKKLGYIKSLGVTCIYLNPIFEAYSNHKYDTGSYLRVDPDFGTMDDLTELIKKAKKRGIKIMLDGVFSHTGDDSIYFNKYGRYSSLGAYQSKDSVYNSWYCFNNQDDRNSYQSWWGIDVLPNTNELDPSFTEFICGEDGVIKHWTRLGLGGWRLDVADELPCGFLTKMVAAAKSLEPEVMFLGEVWEDASNKVAYSYRRRYFEGKQLDSVTNYPFKEDILNYVRNGDGWRLNNTIQVLTNNYPKAVLDNLMNLLGTHDTARLLSCLGDSGATNTRDERAKAKLKDRAAAIEKLRLATVLQFTLPGVPCVYYGDEVGLEGFEDPFNRRCYPWDKPDRALLRHYKNLGKIRTDNKHIYAEGEYIPIETANGIFAFSRTNGRESIITIVNKSDVDYKFDDGKVYKDLVSRKAYTGMVAPNSAVILKEIKQTKARKEFDRWLEKVEDKGLLRELLKLEDNADAIEDAFYQDLEFGTAGMRGKLGVGTNRMNIYTVLKATVGLAEYMKENKLTSAVVSYDSRINSNLFALLIEKVLTSYKIKVSLTDELKPVAYLSFAVRELKADIGVLITASHNPAAYNGYKVYDASGGQVTEAVANKITDKISLVDPFEYTNLIQGLKVANNHNGKIESASSNFISQSIEDKFIAKVKSQSLVKPKGVSVVYTPLNGAGYSLVPQVLGSGVNLDIVPEQAEPDGRFSTCKSPNPSYESAISLAKKLAKIKKADLVLATDPDCDRVSVAVKNQKGDYILLSGNDLGVLLLDFVLGRRKENGSLEKNSVIYRTIVSTAFVDKIAKANGANVEAVLTGFKYIGERIGKLESKGQEGKFAFGFEESSGYLADPFVRDKDAVTASMLAVEMASYLKQQKKTLLDRLEELKVEMGDYTHKLFNFEFDGIEGAKKLKKVLESLRKNPVKEIGGYKVIKVVDYLDNSKTGLPKADVLEFTLENEANIIIRPSGTEPIVKAYLSAYKTTEENTATLSALEKFAKGLFS